MVMMLSGKVCELCGDLVIWKDTQRETEREKERNNGERKNKEGEFACISSNCIWFLSILSNKLFYSVTTSL